MKAEYDELVRLRALTEEQARDLAAIRPLAEIGRMALDWHQAGGHELLSRFINALDAYLVALPSATRQ